MKKILFCIFGIFFANIAFSYDFKDFTNSEWLDDIEYNLILEAQTAYTSPYDIVRIMLPEKNNSNNYTDWGSFTVSGLGGIVAIYSVEQKSKTEFNFVYGWHEYGFQDKPEVEPSTDKTTCRVQIIDENTIKVTDPPYNRCSLLHRFSYLDKKDTDAVVNDSNVRIRSQPNTKGLIYGKLQKGDMVKILGRSELSQADGKSNVWYKIQVHNYPIAWIFGEYITMNTDKAKFNEIIKERKAFDKIPLMSDTDLTRKNRYSEIFFDGSWCTEQKFKNLNKEQLMIYGSGYNEKTQVIKNDMCLIDIGIDIQHSKFLLGSFIIHNKKYKLKAIEYLGDSKYSFKCDDLTVIVTLIDNETIKLEYQNNTEIWKRIISRNYDFRNSKIARIAYDGVCLCKSPSDIDKKYYLNAGQIVTVFEKGSKEKIGPYEDYWYKIDYSTCYINNFYEESPPGLYVYGAFLEILN